MPTSSTIGSVESRSVDLDGRRVAYLTAGPDDSDGNEKTNADGFEHGAPPVVLCHGGGLDRAALSWKHTIPALAADRRVYALDWPGFGESDSPKSMDAVTIDYFTTVLDRFLDALGVETVSLCGISMGGGVALGYALSHSERVSRVALIDSYGLGGEVPGGRLGSLFVRSSLPGKLVSALLARSRRLTALSVASVVVAENLREEFIEEAYAETKREETGETWRAFQRNEVGFGGLRTNYVDRVVGLSMPVLLIHGERDPIVPVAWARRAHASIPDAELCVLANCGHWPTRELPDETNGYLRGFL